MYHISPRHCACSPGQHSTEVRAHAARLSCLRHANPETGPVCFRTRVRGKTAKILDSYAWGCYNMGRTLGDASRCHRPVMPEGRAIVAHPETCPRQARTGPGRGTHIRAFPFQRGASPMHPSPSLHYVRPLLEQRRRRHRRTRRLWGTGLLLGLGLLLGGGWVLLRLVPRSAPQAAVVAAPVVPAPPAGATEPRAIPGEPRWERPVFLAPDVWQPQGCQTLPPWRVACAPDDGFDAGQPLRPWHATASSRRPGALALSTQGPVAMPMPGALAGTTPPGLPARATPPPPRLSVPACKGTPCPAAPAVRRPPPVPARLTAGQKPQAMQLASPRTPVRPVTPQRHVSAYGPTVLREPERLLVSPAEPEGLLLSP